MPFPTLVHEEVIHCSPDALFAVLHTPRAIRTWWGATHAIVVPQSGGYYISAWGNEEDPSYLSIARITEFEAPHRMVLVDYQYYAKNGHVPIDANFIVTFEVSPYAEGTRLSIIHDGFPPGSERFYEDCVRGWKDTCAGIRKYMATESTAHKSS